MLADRMNGMGKGDRNMGKGNGMPQMKMEMTEMKDKLTSNMGGMRKMRKCFEEV